MTDRIPCLCPGCRRTRKAGTFDEWICARHWAAVPRAMRGRYSLYKRRARRDARWIGVAMRMWARCRQVAIEETLMGITL